MHVDWVNCSDIVKITSNRVLRNFSSTLSVIRRSNLGTQHAQFEFTNTHKIKICLARCVAQVQGQGHLALTVMLFVYGISSRRVSTESSGLCHAIRGASAFVRSTSEWPDPLSFLALVI